MKHYEFEIGTEFECGDDVYRCTDIGSRVIVAIRLSYVEVTHVNPSTQTETKRTLGRMQAEREGWFNGPPYHVVEHVFAEEDFPACHRII